MIFGHVPAAFAAGKIVFGRYPNPVALFFLAYLPDLLDKNLYYVFCLHSRGYFHSLAAAAVVSLLIPLAVRMRGGRFSLGLAGYVLFFYVLHLACDWLDGTVLFWPLELGGGGLGLNANAPVTGEFDFRGLVRAFYVSRLYPSWLLAEILCLALSACLVVRSWRAGEFARRPVSVQTQASALGNAAGDSPPLTSGSR